MNKEGIDENYEAMRADTGGLPTQTNKLKQLLSLVSTDTGTLTGIQKSYLSPYEIALILKACKEAGLKFVYDIQAPVFGKQWAKFSEIDLT